MKQNIKIKKGDNVYVLVGKDNGKSGIVDAVLSDNNKIIVKGLNIAKKHVKPSKKYPSGGIIDLNRGMDVSNLGLICPNCGKITRIEYSVEKDVKMRICKKCKKSVEVGAK